jgi:hypothetical protein
MKPTSTFVLKPTKALIVAIGLIAGLFVAQPALAKGKPYVSFENNIDEKKKPGEEEPAKAAKAKNISSSRNNNSVKIYPDIIKRKMHVVAKENEGKEIDFFVFDLQGTLVQNFKMKEKDHMKIAGLARGKYVYRVFSGDEETASGQFEIR